MIEVDMSHSLNHNPQFTLTFGTGNIKIMLCADWSIETTDEITIQIDYSKVMDDHFNGVNVFV